MCDIKIEKCCWWLCDENKRVQFDFEVFVNDIVLDGINQTIGFSQYITNHRIVINQLQEYKTKENIFYLDSNTKTDLLYNAPTMPECAKILINFCDFPYWRLDGYSHFSYYNSFRTYILFFDSYLEISKYRVLGYFEWKISCEVERNDNLSTIKDKDFAISSFVACDSLPEYEMHIKDWIDLNNLN